MENTSLSVEERLQADRTGDYSREIHKQLKQIEMRLASEARKLHDRLTHEKIRAAENAISSATAVIQLFQNVENFKERN